MKTFKKISNFFLSSKKPVLEYEDQVLGFMEYVKDDESWKVSHMSQAGTLNFLIDGNWEDDESENVIPAKELVDWGREILKDPNQFYWDARKLYN